MSKRKYIVRLKEKKDNPEDSIWMIVYGKKVKDLDNKNVYLPDNHDLRTLRELTAGEKQLQERIKDIKSIIKAIGNKVIKL